MCEMLCGLSFLGPLSGVEGGSVKNDQLTEIRWDLEKEEETERNKTQILLMVARSRYGKIFTQFLPTLQ